MISTSAPHIYISALPLSPKSSVVRELYQQYARPMARVVRGLPVSWEPVVTAVHQGPIKDIAWSPCNRFIAITSATVEIIDAVTLKRLSTFESPSNPKSPLLGFSPDGCYLTQFEDGMFTSWDLQTGGPAGTILSPGLTLFPVTSFFSSTYSTDRKMLAVSYTHTFPTPSSIFIATYDLLSRTHTRSYPVSEGRIITPIWTHGVCLRFATVKSGFITIWETEFTLTPSPAEVKSFPVPDEVANGEGLLLHPALSRLAFAHQWTIFVWDVKASKFLLNSGHATPAFDRPAKSHSYRSSFSSDGRVFACLTALREISVWEETASVGYLLHQKFSFLAEDVHGGPLLSPNGESVVVVLRSAIHRWYTKPRNLSLSGVLNQHHALHSSILKFSPDETLAAFGTPWGDKVAIFDLRSGKPQLVINTGTEIELLGMTGSTIIVVSRGKVVTWSIPGNYGPRARADINDSVRTTLFDPSPLSLNHQKPTGTAISPDSSRILVWGPTEKIPSGGGLEIYDVSTGRCLAGVRVPSNLLSACFTPDGLGVWGEDFNSVLGWEVVEDHVSCVKLEPLLPTTCPPRVLPLGSSRGHDITHDGWVLSPTKKRPLWLPDHWRSDNWTSTWGRRFLGLRRRGTLEVVILEFFE